MNKQLQQISENCGPGTSWENIGNSPVSRDTIETCNETIDERIVMGWDLVDANALPDGSVELEFNPEDMENFKPEIYDVIGSKVELRQAV